MSENKIKVLLNGANGRMGNEVIKASTEFENIKIGKWLQNQKSSFRGYNGRKQLTKEQIDKLNNMNIKW